MFGFCGICVLVLDECAVWVSCIWIGVFCNLNTERCHQGLFEIGAKRIKWTSKNLSKKNYCNKFIQNTRNPRQEIFKKNQPIISSELLRIWWHQTHAAEAQRTSNNVMLLAQFWKKRLSVATVYLIILPVLYVDYCRSMDDVASNLVKIFLLRFTDPADSLNLIIGKRIRHEHGRDHPLQLKIRALWRYVEWEGSITADPSSAIYEARRVGM